MRTYEKVLEKVKEVLINFEVENDCDNEFIFDDSDLELTDIVICQFIISFFVSIIFFNFLGNAFKKRIYIWSRF